MCVACVLVCVCLLVYHLTFWLNCCYLNVFCFYFCLSLTLLCFALVMRLLYGILVFLCFSFSQCTSYKLNTLHCSFNLIRVCVSGGGGVWRELWVCVLTLLLCSLTFLIFSFAFYFYLFLERLFKVAFLIYFIFGFHLRFLHLLLLHLLLLLLLLFASVYILL